MCKKKPKNKTTTTEKKVNTLAEQSTVWRSGAVFITVASQ